MHKNLLQIQYHRLSSEYRKLKHRFEKSLKENRFKAYTQRKQRQLISRLEKMKVRLMNLEQVLKLSCGTMAIGFMLNSGEVQAQQAVTVDGEFIVNTHTNNNQRSTAIAMDSDGDFVVTWESYGQDGHGGGIFAQRYNSLGESQGSEFRVNTYTTSFQNSPSIAMDSDGDFVITWQSNGQDGSYYGIYAQRYNTLGEAQGLEFLVNTYTTDDQRKPSIAMDSDGDFVITWESSGQDGSVWSIHAQRYNASGVEQGSEFLVNTYIYYQTNPTIAMDSDGDFVIAWQSYLQDGTYYSIYAQRYNSLGTAQGSEFRVNTYTEDGQLNSSVAMDSDGNFVVTWESDGQDGSYYGIYAQRYNSLGTAQGSEFRVNTYTVDGQSNPSVAMDSDGNFVVTWESYQDGDGDGIYAQSYNASGEAQGLEFLVNTYTTDDQRNAAIAMNSDGDFVVAWQSRNQDGSGTGIYAQRYFINYPPTDISLSASSVDENVMPNTVVGILSTTDPDTGDNFTYSLVAGTGDADNASFDIIGDELLITISPDYEVKNSYSIRIRTTDQNDNYFEKVFTITINDVVETGISNTSASSMVNVYPNPSSGQFTINSDGLALEGYHVRILNLTGETVYTGKFTEQLDLQQLTKGIYTMMLESDKGVVVKQIVIQ